MRNNWVREKLKSGKPSLGCFMGLGSPNVAELLAHAGFEWLVIETEHNALDSAEIQSMLMAINGTPTIPMVRIPSANPTFIQRALDIGGLGLVVPMVRTAQEAEAIVRATRYPPLGTRSFGGLRASAYGLDNEDYFGRANDQILTILIIETKEAVDNLESIARVPGVDAMILGPMDLCLSLGLNPMRQPHKEVATIRDRALGICKQNGVAMGTFLSAPDQVKDLNAQGFQFLAYSADYQMLGGAAKAAMEAFKRETGEK